MINKVDFIKDIIENIPSVTESGNLTEKKIRERERVFYDKYVTFLAEDITILKEIYSTTDNSMVKYISAGLLFRLRDPEAYKMLQNLENDKDVGLLVQSSLDIQKIMNDKKSD